MKFAHRRGRRLLALAFALSLVAFACGGDDDDDASTGGDEAADAPTGTPLVVGWVGTMTSSTGAASTQSKDAMQVWERWTNDNGGINGHPVKVIYEDDKGDPAVGLASVKKLVENDHVIALVNPNPTTEQTWADYVLQKRIPVVHNQLIDALWFTNPMFYPLGGTVVTNIWGQMKAAAAQDAEQVGIILCTEVAACAQAQPLFVADAKAVGLDPVYNVLASQTAANYTAECIGAKEAGADAVAAFIDAVSFARDCARQNYHPIYINSGMGPTLQTINTQPELGKNTVGSSPSFMCLDTDIEAGKTFQAALKKYHPEYAPGGDKRDQFTIVICDAWVGGTGFAKAITNAGVAASATATSEDVIRGLAMFKGETLGGLEPPITLSDGTKPNAQQLCIFLYQWKDAKFRSVPKPGEYTCQPPS